MGSKIYRVEIKSPTGVFYFGSLSAIYDRFSVAEIGCKVTRLWNKGVPMGTPYKNSKCTISQEVLIRKNTKRGGTK
ncbi:MAG: hypothetical protein NTZ69_16005 [Bacteroidia bacterium]|nr:hypothetical protein [Bacteroidia bacterium]